MTYGKNCIFVRLISFVLVLTLLTGIAPFGAIRVYADEEGTQLQQETEEITPDGDPKDTPEGDPEDTPEGDPEDTPEGDPEDTPEGDPEDIPEGDPETDPEEDPNRILFAAIAQLDGTDSAAFCALLEEFGTLEPQEQSQQWQDARRQLADCYCALARKLQDAEPATLTEISALELAAQQADDEQERLALRQQAEDAAAGLEFYHKEFDTLYGLRTCGMLQSSGAADVLSAVMGARLTNLAVDYASELPDAAAQRMEEEITALCALVCETEEPLPMPAQVTILLDILGQRITSVVEQLRTFEGREDPLEPEEEARYADLMEQYDRLRAVVDALPEAQLAYLQPVLDALWSEEDLTGEVLEYVNAAKVPHGSGSRQLNMSGTRFYSEYMISDTATLLKDSYQSAGVDRRLEVYTYLKAGETVYFGSSVDNSYINIYERAQTEDNGNAKRYLSLRNKSDPLYAIYQTNVDIVVVKPDGTKEGFDVKAGQGLIANPTQEKNGPKTDSTTNYGNDFYAPLTMVAPADGVYTFRFHSVTGCNRGDNAVAKGVNEPWSQSDCFVAAWDITVVGKNSAGETEIKTGRTWADYLPIGVGNVNNKASLNVKVLTKDGYQYDVGFQDIAPGGLIFFANNMGFTRKEQDPATGMETYYSLQHSFYDRDTNLKYMNADEKVYLHLPNAADTDLQETYRIFFETPNPDLNGLSYTYKGQSHKFQLQPASTQSITDLKFTGLGENTAQHGQGGVFSFKSSGVSSAELVVDFRQALERVKNDESLSEEERQEVVEYLKIGSGLVELDGAVVDGSNIFYWDGTDSVGAIIPSGMYEQTDYQISIQGKGGEIHFPLIDAEGLTGGVEIHRANGVSEGKYNIYYNNNPLAYGSIEGKDKLGTADKSKHYLLTDNTLSYQLGDASYCQIGKPVTGGTVNAENISTYHRDDETYVARTQLGQEWPVIQANAGNPETQDQKPLGSSLTWKQMYNLVVEELKDFTTYHHEPVNSAGYAHTMKYGYSGFNGGGNQAGVDIWTFSPGTVQIVKAKTGFSILKLDAVGSVSGTIFYDDNANRMKDSGEKGIAGVKVHLVDADGNPVKHTEKMPQFDENGFYLRDENGRIVYRDTPVEFVATTDSKGNYRITGVPYAVKDSNGSENPNGTKYYVQVLLDKSQITVLELAPTTAYDICYKYAEGFLKDNTGEAMKPNTGEAMKGDGNYVRMHKQENGTAYTVNYLPEDAPENAPLVTFDKDNAQEAWLKKGTSSVQLKDIGYTTSVPADVQGTYEVKKDWGKENQLQSITVELWAWDPTHKVIPDGVSGFTSRTGVLVDTVKLDKKNEWKHTWTKMDTRLSYFFVEYYTKHTEDGKVMYNDQGKERLVQIGATLPAMSARPSDSSMYYTFGENLDYPEKTADNRIPRQYFGDGMIHTDATTAESRRTNSDANARQYRMTYMLESSGNTYTTTIFNRQVYDERQYYVWLNHMTELPNFISKTVVEDLDDDGAGEEDARVSHAVTMQHCTDLTHNHANGEMHILGLVITSLDASAGNAEGNSSDSFFFDEDNPTAVLFTANNSIYHTGTGTRTYECKYVVDSGENPVAVLLRTDPQTGIKQLVNDEGVPVEHNDAYTVYTWTLTIHVYDVQPDEIFYDPSAGTIMLQESLERKLNWDFTDYTASDGFTYSVYVSDDDRENNHVFGNDTVRTPLFKGAFNPLTAACADLVGIAYSDHGVLEGSAMQDLTYWDTNEIHNPTVRHDSEGHALTRNADGTYTCPVCGVVEPADGPGKGGVAEAEAYGSGGTLRVELTKPREQLLSTGDDHLNRAQITYTPLDYTEEESFTNQEDIFYYKVVVYGEDTAYSQRQYGQLDATHGVEMYTYIRLIPKTHRARIAGATLSVGSTVDLNFYIAGVLDNAVFDGDGTSDEVKLDAAEHYYMDFTVDNRVSDGLNAPQEGVHTYQNFDPARNPMIPNQMLGAEKVNLYGFSFINLNAYQMNAEVKATLYYKETGSTRYVPVDSRTYSIRQYAENMLTQQQQQPKPSSWNPQLCNMLVDMLNYGSAAQQYAAAQSDWNVADLALANYRLSAAQKALPDAVDLGTLSASAAAVTGGDGITIEGVQLTMEEGMQMSMKVVFSTQSLSGLHLKLYTKDREHLMLMQPHTQKRITEVVDGFELELPASGIEVNGDKTYSVTIHNLPPFFWNELYALRFYQGSSLQRTLTYGVASYMYDMREATDEKLVPLLKSMKRYADSAFSWYRTEAGSIIHREGEN